MDIETRALPEIDRWGIDAEEQEAAAQQLADGAGAQRGPVLGKWSARDGASGFEKQALDASRRERGDVVQLDHARGAINGAYNRGPDEDVEREFVRAVPVGEYMA